MSIIQDIRDKYAKVAIALIALSLVGFLLMDRFSGRGGGGRSQSTSVGSINGKSIGVKDYEASIKMYVDGYERQGMQVTPEMRQNIIGQVWDQSISDIVIQGEADKLGFRIGKKEKGDIYFGENAPQDFKNAGTNESGQYDPQLAKRNIEQYLKNKTTTDEAREQLKKYMDQLVQSRIREKYENFFIKSANIPRWMAEKQISDNSLQAKITVVKSLYNSDSLFRDTTVKVTDQEIADYINKNKDSYKQEESRSINFVTFSAQPTAADTLATKNEVANLKAEFDTTKEVTMFLQRNGSDYEDIFSSGSKLSFAAKDSIAKLPLNSVYGPYLDGSDFVLAKLMETKIFPDSVKCRHVLISTDEAQGGYPDSIASKKIDSIENAIKNGASWADMVEKYNPKSDGSRTTKGEMTFDSYTIQSGMKTGNFAKEFGQFVLFDGKPGDRKKVKTSFGWHYIEVMSFINQSTNYKVAYLKKAITAGQATTDSALQAANNFAGDAKDAKSFDEVFQKTLKTKGYNKGIGQNITRMAGNINGIPGYARQLVKDIYAAKLGEVLKPAEIGENWVVAVVTEINEKGTASVAKVRAGLEPMLRHKKIAMQLKQKAGKISSLDAVATLLGKPVQTIDSIRMNTGNPKYDMPFDGKATGVIFNPANKGKIYPELIVGEFGVYAIQVDNVVAVATGENVADFRKQQAGQAVHIPLQVLKDKANINDRRMSGTNNY